MASLIYLDTHVVAWMFAGRHDLLPASARRRIDENDLRISPAVVLELQYLFEIGRTAEAPGPVIESLRRETGLQVCDLPFPEVVERALSESWTRDPFDRLIAAHSRLAGSLLITRDGPMRANCSWAVWNE